jgi:hypothetical protein
MTASPDGCHRQSPFARFAPLSEIRGALRIMTFAVVLTLFFSAVVRASEPIRSEHENWMAVVEEDGRRHCGPRGYLFSNRKVPDFQLRVMRGDGREPCRITLVSPFRFLDPQRKMRARIDGGPQLRLDVAAERAGGGGITRYTVTHAPTAAILLRRIRAGAWIRFDYSDPVGQRSSAVFSLMGASAALDAIGCPGRGR